MSDGIILEPVVRLSRDLKQAAKTLSTAEARFLCDSYYQMQGDRIRSENQVRAVQDTDEPHMTLSWLSDNSRRLENNIKSALDAYGDAHVVGRWSKSIVGIGPVLSAGLIANIEMEPWRCAVAYVDRKEKTCSKDEPHDAGCHAIRVSTVGHIWRFAGLDPTVTWEKGELTGAKAGRVLRS